MMQKPLSIKILQWVYLGLSLYYLLFNISFPSVFPIFPFTFPILYIAPDVFLPLRAIIRFTWVYHIILLSLIAYSLWKFKKITIVLAFYLTIFYIISVILSNAVLTGIIFQDPRCSSLFHRTCPAFLEKMVSFLSLAIIGLPLWTYTLWEVRKVLKRIQA